MSQAPEPVVFVGDSITEAALLPSEICGHPVVNAGIGGTTPNTYLALARYRGLLEPMNASLVVIALGTNNAQTIISPAGFEASYRSLIDKLKPRSGKIILATTPAIEQGSIAQYFDATRIAPINSTIKRLAGENKFGFVDHGELETVDGVHLSASGYKPWLHSIEVAARKALACSATAEAH